MLETTGCEKTLHQEKLNQQLMKSTKNSDFAGVRNAVLAGAVCVEDIYGYTPLHYAALTGQTEMLSLLIKNGADVDAVNEYGRTPLHLAASHNQTKAVKILLKNGADINARDEKGGTPRDWAIDYGEKHIINFMHLQHVLLDPPEDQSADEVSTRDQARYTGTKIDISRALLSEDAIDIHSKWRESLFFRTALEVSALAVGFRVYDINQTRKLFSELLKSDADFINQRKGYNWATHLGYIEDETLHAGFHYRDFEDLTKEVLNVVVLPEFALSHDLGKIAALSAEGVSNLQAELYPDAIARIRTANNSRTLITLLNIWHDSANRLPEESRPSLPIGNWERLFDEVELQGGFSIVCLGEPDELEGEGKMLDHCVGNGSYAQACRAGKNHILSLRQNNLPLATIEIEESDKGDLQAPESESFQIVQIRAEGNEDPDPEMVTAFMEFGELFNSGQIELNRERGEIIRPGLKEGYQELSAFEKAIGIKFSELDEALQCSYDHYREKVSYRLARRSGKRVTLIKRTARDID